MHPITMIDIGHTTVGFFVRFWRGKDAHSFKDVSPEHITRIKKAMGYSWFPDFSFHTDAGMVVNYIRRADA